VLKNPNSGTVPLAVTVPVSGTFSLTVDSADTVILVVSGNTATAAATPVVVSDTRNTYPGWVVSGQVDDFTNAAAGTSISGDQLGWMPTGSSLAPGVLLGRTVPRRTQAWVPCQASWHWRTRVTVVVSGPARSART
jgi:hypothetical protein